MIKFLFFYFTLSSLLLSSSSESCIDSLYFSNKHIFNNKFIKIKTYFSNNDSLIIYIERNKRSRINFDNKIIISDKTKIINYNYKTNQLFIDKPDSILNDLILMENDSLFFSYLKKRKYNNINNIKIYTNKICSNIDSITFSNNGMNYKFQEIILDTIGSTNLDSLFKLNIDESKVFKYDFR